MSSLCVLENRPFRLLPILGLCLKICHDFFFLDLFIAQERVKAQEQRKQNVMEYRRFLESCDFIKVPLS